MKDWAVTLLVVVVSVVQAKPSGHHGGVSDHMVLEGQKMFIEKMCAKKKDPECESIVLECMGMMETASEQPTDHVGEESSDYPDLKKMCGDNPDQSCQTMVVKCTELLSPPHVSAMLAMKCAGQDMPNCKYNVIDCMGVMMSSREKGKNTECTNDTQTSDCNPRVTECTAFMASLKCSRKDVPDCEAKVTDCLTMMLASPGPPNSPPDVNAICTEETHPDCSQKITECKELMRPDPVQKAAMKCAYKDVPDCEAKVVDCITMMMPAEGSPKGPPDVNAICTEESQPDCQMKVMECMTLLEPDFAWKAARKCANADIPDCEVRVMKCMKMMMSVGPPPKNRPRVTQVCPEADDDCKEQFKACEDLKSKLKRRPGMGGVHPEPEPYPEPESDMENWACPEPELEMENWTYPEPEDGPEPETEP